MGNRSPLFKVPEKNPIPRRYDDYHDRLEQSPLDVAMAGYEVLDRSLRATPFSAFGTPPPPSKIQKETVITGADSTWDQAGIRLGFQR